MRLISLIIPFMKMIALGSGKQHCIHGPAVSVPSKVDNVYTLLPRLITEAELIPLDSWVTGFYTIQFLICISSINLKFF